jgi:hypothetical protein
MISALVMLEGEENECFGQRSKLFKGIEPTILSALCIAATSTSLKKKSSIKLEYV